MRAAWPQPTAAALPRAESLLLSPGGHLRIVARGWHDVGGEGIQVLPVQPLRRQHRRWPRRQRDVGACMEASRHVAAGSQGSAPHPATPPLLPAAALTCCQQLPSLSSSKAGQQPAGWLARLVEVAREDELRVVVSAQHRAKVPPGLCGVHLIHHRGGGGEVHLRAAAGVARGRARLPVGAHVGWAPLRVVRARSP